MNTDLTVRLRRLAVDMAIDQYGLLIDPERITVGQYVDIVGKPIFRALFTVATQDEPIAHYPTDWWQHFKQRWFPAWLLKRFPVQFTEVIARHTFPELHVPTEILQMGREFVTIHYLEAEDVYGN